jgi:hypothetical protein
MKTAIVAAAAAGLIGAAHADLPMPASIGVHVATAHFTSGEEQMGPRGWNSVNPGVYARWGNGVTVGGFRNSEYRTSFYAGWTLADKSDTLALIVGGVTGYDRSPVLPLVVPSVRIGLGNTGISARLSLLLPPNPKRTGAIHLSLEYQL